MPDILREAVPAVNPLTLFPWYVAYWASDPLWTPPADGASVSSWRDGSRNGKNPLLGGAGLVNGGTVRPVYRAADSTMNNKPTIHIQGASDGMQVINLFQIAPWTCVFISPSIFAANRLVHFNNGFAIRVIYANGVPQNWVYQDSNTLTSTADTTPTNRATLVAFSEDTFSVGSLTTTGRIFINETATDIIPNAVQSGGNPLTSITMGYFTPSSWQARYGFFGIYPGEIQTLRASADWKTFIYWAKSYYDIKNIPDRVTVV